ncbi:MAG: phosphotransferase [Alicyclobacillaceae bacterium]|nr:phosphotransferase [Alicyclobacillaceae bacterium]
MHLTEFMEKMYGMRVAHIQPKRRNVFLLRTTDGTQWCVKVVQSTPEHLRHLLQVSEYLQANGFVHCPLVQYDKSGKAYVSWRKKFLFVTNWIPGENPHLSDINDWNKALQTLAVFHQHAVGYPLTLVPTAKIQYHRVLERVESGKQIISHLSHVQKKYERFFDLLDVAEDSVKHPLVQQSIERERLDGSFIHGDYNYPNLVFDTHRQLHLIDFDNTSMQGRMMDLAHLLHRNAAWDGPRMVESISTYDRQRTLGKTEKRYLFTLLHVPYPVLRWYNMARRHGKSGSEGGLSLPSRKQLHQYAEYLNSALL